MVMMLIPPHLLIIRLFLTTCRWYWCFSLSLSLLNDLISWWWWADTVQSSYVKSELEALEKEQRQIDAEAAVLETKLRMIMEKGEETWDEMVFIDHHSLTHLIQNTFQSFSPPIILFFFSTVRTAIYNISGTDSTWNDRMKKYGEKDFTHFSSFSLKDPIQVLKAIIGLLFCIKWFLKYLHSSLPFIFSLSRCFSWWWWVRGECKPRGNLFETMV